MKIAFIASGSRGDVQPYVALGRGLVQAGHQVSLASSLDFEDLVTRHGVEFFPMAGSVQDIVQSQGMRDKIEGGNFLVLMAQMAKEAEGAARSMAQAAMQSCQGADLVIGGMGGEYVGGAVAEKLGIPFLPAFLVPFSTTSEFPSVLTANLPLPGVFNRATHQMARQLMWQGFRRADQIARQEVIGLPPAPFFGPTYSLDQAIPTLYGFSPAVISKPADWGENVYITGYWFLEAEKDWTPPQDLAAFLSAGEAPVYIGFGSMSNRDPRATADLVIEALRQSRQRGLVQTGWGGLEQSDLPDWIYMAGSLPHSWLFPRMKAVVHHGGVGTTAAGLRAGVPNLVVPFFGDQPFWGQRVAALGVGPKPIPRKSLTVERLANAIGQMASDQGMQTSAADLGFRIQAEDGIAKAVTLIEQAVLT
jgi:UDP:flavonoid glycosyltransferase YjiC (YdhE family)